MRRLFRRGFVGSSLILVLVSATARPQSADPVAPSDVATVVCPPVPGPITIDGEIQEWTRAPAIRIGESQLVLRDPQYQPPGDLSGDFHVARDATNLYVAGRIQDDTLFWNPQVPWNGDGVELFLDFHPDPSSRETDAYDSYTSQLILHPLAREAPWTLATFRGNPGRMDDPVDGVRLAGLPLRNANDATIGYTFELVLPLSNFIDEELAPGRTIGFDIALSDSDGLPEQKNYGTWSGNAKLSVHPSGFGRMVMGDPPPSADAPDRRGLSPTGPTAVFGALLAILLFVWLARVTRPSGRRLGLMLDRLRRIQLWPKLVAAGVVFALLVAAEIGAERAAAVLVERDVDAHAELARMLQDTAAEAQRLGLRGTGDTEAGSPLIDLLAGATVRPTERYEHTIVPVVSEVPHRTADAIPFLRRDLVAAAARPASFVVHPAALARRATIVASWHASSNAEPAVPGDVVGEVRLVHEDGRVAPVIELTLGRNVAEFVDDAAAPPEATPAFTGAVPGAQGAAPGSPTKGRAWAVTVDVPEEAVESPIVRVELEARSAVGTIVLHGATLHGDPGTAPRPLRLGRRTESGIPTGASPAPPPFAVATLSADAPWHVIRDLNVAADRLWIVAGLRRDFPARRFRAPVVQIEAVFDDGSVEGPFRLENGVTVEPETAPARQHPTAYEAEVAFEWGEPGRTRRHYDVVQLRLERTGRRLRELQLEFTGEDEIVTIAAVTAGAVAAQRLADDLVRLERASDGLKLRAPDLESLAGIDFTLYRGGQAVATTLPGETRERTLARRLSAAQTTAIDATPDSVHEIRVADGERLHALLVPLLATSHAEVLDLVWKSTADAHVRGWLALARAILSALLVPLLVLVAADLTLLVPSLHVRLVTTFATAAAIPIVLAAFAMPQLVGAKIEGAEEEAVRSKSGAVQRRLTTLRSNARRLAEQALGREALVEALLRRELPDDEYRAAIGVALRDAERSLAADAGGEARIVLEVSPPPASDRSTMVFPEQARWTVFSSPIVNITDAFARRWSRLYASGVAKTSDAANWKTTLVVELPLERNALEDAARAAGGSVQVLLYAPNGFPLASTLEARGEELSEERSRKRSILRRVLTEQEPVIEPAVLKGTLYTVSYDVLREGANPVCLVATALPRAGTEALVQRVESVSLLIFGAGVLMQFLLAGVVVGGATRRLDRVLGRARLAAPTASEFAHGNDDITALDVAVRELRRDREVFRAELGHLHDAVGRLALSRTPDEVADIALDIVRQTAAPWGALLLVPAATGTEELELAAGYRGDEAVSRAPIRPADDDPLRRPAFGGGEWRGRAAVLAGSDLAPHARGAETIDAFPLGGVEGPHGALLLLHAPGTRPREHHAEFVAAFARHVGQAFAAARLVRLAVRDPDTGAYVASYFDQRLMAEVDRAVAAREPIAMLLARVDGVAQGAAGRDTRVRIARRLVARAPTRAFTGVREGGIIAIAVPDADREVAERLAHELRRDAMEDEDVGVRVTFGYAACPDDAGSFEFLLAEAQRQLVAGPGRAAVPVRSEQDGSRLVEEAAAGGAVFVSQEGVRLLETVERIAASDLTILIEGETGVGKEVVAELIHRKSARRDAPLIKVNCAALPDALLESELFGYEQGAFTGADRRKPGRFELADGGTIFLDEIGEIPLSTQVKLLRVLEDRIVEHLGGTEPLPIDVRVIAATNRDLRREVAHGRFREDLFYRLNAVGLAVPPLRARKEDIPALAEELLRRAAIAAGRPAPAIAPDAMDLLYRHSWPGNVRELRNALDQAVVLTDADVLRAADLRPALRSSTARPPARGSAAPARDRGAATANLSDRQRRAIDILTQQEWITNSEYCDLVSISTRTGLRDLKELIALGLLEMQGKRRGARYRLPR